MCLDGAVTAMIWVALPTVTGIPKSGVGAGFGAAGLLTTGLGLAVTLTTGFGSTRGSGVSARTTGRCAFVTWTTGLGLAGAAATVFGTTTIALTRAVGFATDVLVAGPFAVVATVATDLSVGTAAPAGPPAEVVASETGVALTVV